MKRAPFTIRPSAITLALMALASSAHSQQAPAAGSEARTLETVTVTATRRSERLQDVPLSVSTVNAEQLQNAGVTTVQDIGNAVSGVTFGLSPQDAGFRVRGVGTLGGFTSASEQPVGVVIDGVVMGLGTVLENMLDVERIEALKGPQGTQFGKNASSGVVSITTRKPRLGRFEGLVTGSYGSLNEHDVGLVLNAPLGASAALRVAVFDRGHDGFVKSVPLNESWGGKSARGGRVKVLLQPTKDLDLTLSADATRVRTDGPGQLWTARVLPASMAAGFAAQGITPGPDNTLSAENASSFTNVDADGGSAEVNLRLGEYTLTSVTAHRARRGSQRYGLDSVANTVFEGGGTLKYEQDSQELRITSPRGVLEYVAGGYWSRLKSATFDSAFLRPSALGAPAPPNLFTSVTNGINNTTTSSESLAAFADGKVKLGSSLSVLAGVRYTRDEVTARNRVDTSQLLPLVGVPPAPGFLVPNTGRPDREGTTTASKASGRLGAEFKPSKDLLLYGTLARGYLGPTITFSGQSGTRSDVKPQQVDDVTLGFKAELAGRAITVNGSLFHDRYKNLQVGVFRAANNEFITENAGGMTSKGAELDVSLRLGAGLTGRASVTYADAKFTDYVTACPATGDKTRCFTVGSTSLYQAAGDDLPGAPKVTAAFGLDYGTSVGSFLLDASLSASHRSKTSFGVGETAYSQGGYEIVNVAVKLAPESDRWHVSLWTRNLFDKHYQAAVINMPFAPPGGVVNWNTRDARRTVGVTAGLKF